MRRPELKKYTLLLGGLLILSASCDRDRKHPGWDYFPDMFYSNAYETWAPNENFPDGKTLQSPVDGTLSRDALPFAYGTSTDERTRAGIELKNPQSESENNLIRGEAVYSAFCAGCHGDPGDGKGHLVTSAVYKYPVRTLVSEEMKNRPDGEIYHSITLGYGVMGAHGFMIRPEERWKAILYVRKLQQTQ
jgi:mono/diheme cytochrome c family protein